MTGRTLAHLTECAVAGALIALAGIVIAVDRQVRRSVKARRVA